MSCPVNKLTNKQTIKANTYQNIATPICGVGNIMQKGTSSLYFASNFAKCRPIFKILSSTELAVNF